jgi:hypothetical protein
MLNSKGLNYHQSRSFEHEKVKRSPVNLVVNVIKNVTIIQLKSKFVTILHNVQYLQLQGQSCGGL